jgi:hypothetical protein
MRFRLLVVVCFLFFLSIDGCRDDCVRKTQGKKHPRVGMYKNLLSTSQWTMVDWTFGLGLLVIIDTGVSF